MSRGASHQVENSATKDECAYHSELCAHWAAAVEQYALRLQLVPAPETLDQVQADDLSIKDRANRAILGALPRGSKLPALLTDFLQDTTIPLDSYPFLEHAKPGSRLPDNSIFQKGARLLQVWNDQKGDETDGKHRLMAKIGLPVEPLEYVAKAVTLIHPNLQRVKMSAALETAIDLCGTGKALKLRRIRIGWTKQMVSLAESCRTLEESLRDERPQHLQTVLMNKKFGLLHEVLKSFNYPDACVAREASQGFPLVGWMKTSGVFAAHVRPPSLHVSAFEAMAAAHSARTVASVKPSLDAELDREVWAATMAEVAGGTLDGPYEVSDLPPCHVASPRFGIRQGQKVRPIDNLSVSGLNCTVGLPERLQVDTIDEVASMIKRCMQMHGTGCSLVGRTYDLRKAYRQLGVCEEHYKFSWIAVWSTDHQQVKLFRMKGLPFGGTASVASFLRMSRALKELGIACACLVWSSFFDDFVCVARPEDADSTDLTVRFLFKMFGWVLSEDPEKDMGFRPVFSALGVEFDLRDVSRGILRIGNTQKRKDELRELVSTHIKSDSLSPEESESIRSRLMFAVSQLYGRSAKLALKAIGSPAASGKRCSPLTDDVKFGLDWMLRRLVEAPPREIRAQDSDTLFLFLDGAWEPVADQPSLSVTSIGAVLVDGTGRGLCYFGMRLPVTVTDAWSGGRSRNLVFEAEVLPYCLALHCWGNALQDRHVVVFIDNDGARHSWISGGAESKYAGWMIHQGTLEEARLNVVPYFSRVPSASNIADGPSRMWFDLCIQLGAVRTDVDESLVARCALYGRSGVECALG